MITLTACYFFSYPVPMCKASIEIVELPRLVVESVRTLPPLQTARRHSRNDAQQPIAAGGKDPFDGNKLLSWHHTFPFIGPLRVDLAVCR